MTWSLQRLLRRLVRRRVPLPVRESAVMGRSAVAVVIACWQIPALGYLIGLTSSVAVSESGSIALQVVWSGSFILAGVLMIAVYRVRAETDKAVLEIGALVVFTAAMCVYLALILQRAESLNGRLAILALLLSLIFNLIGRGALLVRQIRFVRSVTKGAQ